MIGAAVGINKPPDFRRWMDAWGEARVAVRPQMSTEQIEAVFDGLVRASGRGR